MKTQPRLAWIILALVLSGCGSYVPGPTPVQDGLPFILVTKNPEATFTPTPFQPAPPTPTIPPLSLPTIQPTQTVSQAAGTATTIPAMTPTNTADVNVVQPPATFPPLASDQETINFLLIGSDKRPGGSFRTDTLVIAILRPKDNQVTLISIPRDLWVNIPTWGMQRINTAYQHGHLYGYPGGGPGLLADTVENNLGIRIDHTAMVEFNGFRQIVDTLGGIDVPVACPYTDWHLIDPSYDPENENNWSLYTVGPGIVHMDGDLSLWYARSRMKSSDFDRGRRQQEVLRSIYARTLTTDTLGKIPQLYQDMNSVVTTDLGLNDILQLASLAPGMTNANIRSYYIQPPLVTPWITPAGASVLLINEAPLQQMIQQAMSPSPRAKEREKLLIQVENGTIAPDLDSLAASRLNYAGFAATLAPADRKDYTYSVLIDLTTGQDYAQRAGILSSVGLTNISVIALPDPASVVPYRLIIGTDYQPCFNPKDLAP